MFRGGEDGGGGGGGGGSLPPEGARGGSQMDLAEYALFVSGAPQDKSSMLAVKVAQSLDPTGSIIAIKRVETMPAASRPAWLTGVPTLVSFEKDAVYTGTRAHRALDKLLAARAPALKPAAAPSSSSAAGAGIKLDTPMLPDEESARRYEGLDRGSITSEAVDAEIQKRAKLLAGPGGGGSGGGGVGGVASSSPLPSSIPSIASLADPEDP